MTTITAAEVRRLTAAALRVSEDQLTYITDAYIAERERADTQDVAKEADFPKDGHHTSKGNRFMDVGTKWTWCNGNGTPCGHKNNWVLMKHPTVSVALSGGGACDDGYPWVQIDIYVSSLAKP